MSSNNFKYWNDENNTFHSDSQYYLYIVNTDGTDLTLIDRIDNNDDGHFGCATWSPDDSKILYVRSYDSYINKYFLILHNISENTNTILQTEGNVCSPSFSPDGKKIVYVSSKNDKEEIFIMNADGNKKTRLTKAEYFLFSALFQNCFITH